MKKFLCRFFLHRMALFALLVLTEPSIASIQCPVAHPQPFPLMRANREEIANVLSKSPKMIETIKNIEDRTLNYWRPESKLPITLYIPPKLQSRHNSIDPIIKKTIEAVWDKQHDQKAFVQYMRETAEDVAVELSKRKNPKYAQELNLGQISRTLVLIVLFKRFKAEGNNDISVLWSHLKPQDKLTSEALQTSRRNKLDTNEGFREAVKQGPFFDKAFSGDPHGEDTHLFQASYVADVIWKETNGNPRLFWNFISSKEGILYWDILFDGGGASYASPEYLATIIRNLLSLQ